MQMLMLMIQLMMGRRADGQMSITKDTEGDIDAAAKYTDADAANGDDTSDADDTADEEMLILILL